MKGALHSIYNTCAPHTIYWNVPRMEIQDFIDPSVHWVILNFFSHCTDLLKQITKELFGATLT